MKQIYFSFIALFLFSNAQSQCDAPELLYWVNVGDTAFTVIFDSPTEAQYELEVRADYGFSDFLFVTQNITGDAVAGTNSVDVVVNSGLPNPARIYFTAILSLECEAGVVSDSTKFYMSAHSLTGEAGFNCDSLFYLFEPLPDLNGVPFIATFEVPDEGEVIESLSVFLDIGHTYNGDLSVFLTHPNGTEIVLLDFDNGANNLGSSWGFSAIITDNAGQALQNSGQGLGPRGIYSPQESFSPLIGEPLAGVWTLTVIDNLGIDDGMLFGTCLKINGIPCLASVEGRAFIDLDENGFQNGTEPGYPYAYIENTIDGSSFFSDGEGDFWNCSDVGLGELEILNVPQYFEAASLDISVEEDQQLEELWLAITPDQFVSDIEVDLASLEPNRPGFEAVYSVQINNVGTICESDFSVDIEFPDYVEILSSTDGAVVISENTASRDIIIGCPFDPFEFQLTILLDDTVSLGTQLEATITANVGIDEVNPINNTFTSSVIVVGSYDPNDKQVSEVTIGDDFLEEGSPLKYTIRFQNTGTFYAERVVIADTIDANLDLNSLQILSTSHNLELVREGNVLYFEYDQIFLPDSTTDFDGSIGYVRYQIDPLPSFSQGETIENTAYIYFDFNEPIVTNTVVTEFANPPLSVANEVDFETRIYPNPVIQNLTVSWNQDLAVDRIEIYDLQGRRVFEEVVRTTDVMEVDLSNLHNGVYLVNVVAGELQSRQKFIKLGER